MTNKAQTQIDLRFENIPNIDKADYFDEKKDEKCFIEIGKILYKYNFLKKYVITLLHTHFEISDDEILLEYSFYPKKHVGKSPFKVSSLTSYNIIPTSWRLTDNSNERLVPLEYSTEGIIGFIPKYNHIDFKCFSEIYSILSKYNNVNRFGIALNYDNIKLNKDYVSIETTLYNEKILSIKPIQRKHKIIAKAVRTTWQFNESIIHVSSTCKKETTSWCERYCECPGDYCKTIDYQTHTGETIKRKNKTIHTKKSSINHVEYREDKKSGGGCFISSATLISLGKDDNCFELNTFRRFRDSWLSKQKNGKKLISDYYYSSPNIVKEINKKSNSSQIYLSIWDNYLKEFCFLILNNKFSKAKKLYVEMVKTLKEKYN